MNEYAPDKAKQPAVDSTPEVVSGLMPLGLTLSSPISGSVDRGTAARAEERGLELDPLVRFENQIVSNWLPNALPEKIEETMILYHHMRAQGHLTIQAYSAKQLAGMYARGRIHWCEPELFERKIDSISFPIVPEYNLVADNVGGPVIFVGSFFDKDQVSVLQGNHRTAAVLFRGQEHNQSLYVLRFRASTYSQQLIGATPSEGFRSPKIPIKYSFSSSFGASHG